MSRVRLASAFFLALFIGLVVGPLPANATITDCAPHNFCLFHWVNHQGGHLRINVENPASSGCVNLSSKKYTDGYNANDSSASILDNSASSATGYIVFYDWVNCNELGASIYIPTGKLFVWSNLNNYPGAGSWYHRFTSYRVL